MSLVLGLLLASSAVDAMPIFQRVDRVAMCMIRRDRVAAARLASAKPGRTDGTAQLAALPVPLQRCGALPADMELVGGAIAQRLLNEIVMRSRLSPLTPERERELADGIIGHDPSEAADAAAVRCLAFLKPAATTELIRSKVGSDAEAAALRSVTSALSQCVEAGQQVRWSALQLRFDLARERFRTGVADLVIEQGF